MNIFLTKDIIKSHSVMPFFSTTLLMTTFDFVFTDIPENRDPST